MKNVKNIAVHGSARRATGGGVTTKTLLATALFAALASTSITAQSADSWWLSYGDALGTVYGASNEVVGIPTPTDLAGVQLNTFGADVEINSGTIDFIDKSATPANEVALGSASTYSLLIVKQGQELDNTSGNYSITLNFASGGVDSLDTPPKSSSLVNFVGLTLQDAASLSMGQGATAITLNAADNTGLAGLNLVGMDLSAGSDTAYTGATETGTDAFNINAVNANATALKVGAGSYAAATTVSGTAAVTVPSTGYTPTSPATLTAYGATVTTGSLADVGTTTSSTFSGSVTLTNLAGKGLGNVNATAAGIVLSDTGSEGSVSLAGEKDATISVTGQVTTVAGFTGTATAYGANVMGGETFTIGSDKASTSVTVTGKVTQTGAVVAGQANAYGISATGATVVFNGGSTQGTVTGTVGGSSVESTGNAAAYGIYATGESNITIIGGTKATTISAVVGNTPSQAIDSKTAVNQVAAGIYADNSVVTINGGTKTDITGSDQNQYTNKTQGNIGVYGLYATNNSTLTITGVVGFNATGATPLEGTATQYTVAAMKLVDSDTTITVDPESTTTATTATFNNDVIYESGTLTILGGAGSDSDTTQGGTVTYTGANNADFTANGTAIKIQGGAASEEKAAAGGNATLVVQGTGDFAMTGGSLVIEAASSSEAQTTAAGGTASLSIVNGEMTNVPQITVSGGDATEKGGAGSAASITASGTLDVSGSVITLEAGKSATAVGGAATIEVTEKATLNNNSSLVLNSSQNAVEATTAGGAGTAKATFKAGLVLGTAESTDDVSTVTVDKNSQLILGSAAAATSVVNSGSSISIANGGNLTLSGTGTSTLTIEEGASLNIAQGATVTSTIANNTTIINGTLAITGTEKDTPYNGGLGKVTVNGTVTPTDGSLYLQLKADATNPDQLEFGTGSSMNAAQLGVGLAGTAGTATLTVNGGTVDIAELIVGTDAAGNGQVTVDETGVLNVGELTIGGNASNTVTLSGGFLNLEGPTTEGGETTSNLTIETGGSLVFDGGTLVTDSGNLWEQTAKTQITEEVTLEKIFDTGITYTNGGYIELTDKTVETSWYDAATGQIGNVKFILDGQLVTAGKAVNLMPTDPTNGELPKNARVFNGGKFLGNALNANPYTTTPSEAGGKTTSYQNLIIGTAPNAKVMPWTQPEGTTAWTINEDEIGFANIQIGDSGNILLTGQETLVLAGNGQEIVSGNNVNFYVGTQETTSTQQNSGTLILGYTPTSALGGELNGNLTVYDGLVQVNYGTYTVTGALTLGQEKTTTYSATPGSLQIANKGTLTVGSIAGGNVGNGTDSGIDITDGSTLAVQGSMNVTLVTIGAEDGPNEFNIDDSTLTVAQDLTVSAVAKADPVVMVASDSTVTAGSLTANNVMIGLDGSTMTIAGAFSQNAANKATLALAAVSGSKLAVNGDLTTQATTVWANDSEITVGGIFAAGQAAEGTATPTKTNLILDGATISANTINLTNVNTALFSDELTGVYDADLADYQSFYSSGDITATSAMNLVSSTIELDSGSLTVGALSIDPKSQLSLGTADLEDVNDALTEAGKATVTDMIVQASIGTANVAGDVFINGTSAESLTKVAIGELAFAIDATADNATTMVVNGNSALILGTSDTSVFDKPATTSSGAREAAAPATTTYLVAGRTVQLGLNNGFAIGTTTPAQNSGVTIGDGTAVIINPELLAQSNSIYGNPGERQADLFYFNKDTLEEGQTAPEVDVSQNATFVVSNPLGNLTINLANGLTPAEGMTLSNDQLPALDNPLYEAVWDPAGQIEGSDPAEYSIPNVVIRIIPEQVSGQPDSVNSLGTNTILDAAQNIGFGINEGADKILRLLSTATSANKASDYIRIRDQINQWALQGAAAHAHEIGISAASMVVDSVWDHSSKLAAAPHEEAKGDVWITLDWNHSRANDYKAGGLDNGYKLDLYGATFGADYDFANGLAAGLAVSVGGGEAKSKGINAGQKTDVTYWGINLYGTYASPIVNVIGNVGYIGIKNKTKVGGDKGRPDANIWTIGVKAEKDFAINEQFTVTPHVGVRYLSVDVDDFNLGGFHYGTDKANLVQFPIGVAFAANLKTANGASVKPFLDLSFVPTAGDKKVDNTFGITGGNASDVIDTTIASTSMFQGKIGVNASYGAHNFGLNFAIGGGNKGRLDTGLQAKYRFVF